jgi:hypothetical protein
MPCEPHPQFGMIVDPAAWASYEPVKLLPEVAVIIECYLSLRIGSAGNGWGPTPITWETIDAYSRVTRMRLDNWVLNLIRMVDSIYLRAAREKSEQQRQNQPRG